MVFLAALLTIPVGTMDAIIAAFLRPYVDQVILGHNFANSLFIPTCIILFSLAQGLCIYFSAYANAWVGNRVTLDAKKELFHKLLSMDVCFFDRSDSGTIALHFNQDAETGFKNLMGNGKAFITRIFSSIGLTVVLFINSWKLAFLALLTVIFIYFPIRIVRKKMRFLTKKNDHSGASATVFYNEVCQGNRTIISYGLQANRERHFHGLLNEIFAVSMRMTRHSNWLSPVMHFIVAIGLSLVLLLGGWLVQSGHMSSGAFVSFIAALLLMYTPIKNIGNNFVAVQASLVAVERIQETLKMNSTSPAAFEEDAEPICLDSEITFRDVSFEYQPGQPVLKNINFSIPAGKTVGIVGHSGGGKTSLIHLLARLYDVTGGAIEIDGQNIQSIPIARLHRSMAIVFQDNFLFSGTIRENILLGNFKGTEEDVKTAVRLAYLEDFIASLPLGLETPVGERGILLSGGQKQRIAIARAMVRNSPIVILDEATSALDNRSEANIQEALNNLMEDKTVLIIAHRLTTLSRVNFILVLNNCGIAESGTEEELLKNPNGIYAQMHQAQFNKSE
ncbi:MAG: ABC transporter ATP-binding protein/permease [Puniceicoccales bacterium]|jgi:subfamily B ATP-binding cassette protein MsbA|nr:ABC transporter ATP-binding protein/permease [Puniceicoccales bacterium]